MPRPRACASCEASRAALLAARLPARASACESAGAMVTEAQVRAIAMRLPDALERASYGDCPSWRTKKRMFAWIRQAPEALVIWVDSLDAKELLLEAEPELFFTTSHYDGYPMLLARLEHLDSARARALIEESYRLRVGALTAKRASAAKRTSTAKRAATKAARRVSRR
jgi:hypothetical protein